MVTLTHSPIQCFVVACSESMLFRDAGSITRFQSRWTGPAVIDGRDLHNRFREIWDVGGTQIWSSLHWDCRVVNESPPVTFMSSKGSIAACADKSPRDHLEVLEFMCWNNF